MPIVHLLEELFSSYVSKANRPVSGGLCIKILSCLYRKHCITRIKLDLATSVIGEKCA